MNIPSGLSLTLPWSAPERFSRLQTIDLHTAGEPLRVILTGFPEASGEAILTYRQRVRTQADALRKALMWEPRGHADMYGCLLTPPVSPEADFGTIFLHNEGYSTMCGHAIIALATLVLETGMLPVQGPITPIGIDTPAGLVRAYARWENKRVSSVHFHNVPAFVTALDQIVEVKGLGKVPYDLAYGGAFYAYVQAEALGLSLLPENVQSLIEAGRGIKQAVISSSPHIVHPHEPDLSFLYGTIFIGPSEDPAADDRNVCIFADGEVDRSPTGTGVSGRMALHFARGEMRIGDRRVIESIIGSRFTGSIVSTTQFGPHPAVIPQVEGQAFITGQHEFLLDSDDPWREGFILR